MSDGVKNIFISHVHEDDDELRKLKDLLAKKGYEIRDSSIDSSKPNDAQDPDYIKSQILAPRIQWAGAVIVIISADTHESDWVNWEIEYAEKCGKRIVGVWAHGASDSDLPTALEEYADSVELWNADAIIAAINGETSDWHQSDGSVRPPRVIDRYSC